MDSSRKRVERGGGAGCGGGAGGGAGRSGGGERRSAAETSHAGLPVWLRNEGKGHRHAHAHTHTYVHGRRHTHTHTWGRAWPPRLISGAQRPQTEVAEDTQWEQGLKAWFTSALREGEGARGGVWVRGGGRER